MKTTVIAMLLALSAQAGAAQVIEGKAAEKLFEFIYQQGAVYVENTVCLTTLELDNVSCSLLGSHGACGGRPVEYVCSIN